MSAGDYLLLTRNMYPSLCPQSLAPHLGNRLNQHLVRHHLFWTDCFCAPFLPGEVVHLQSQFLCQSDFFSLFCLGTQWCSSSSPPQCSWQLKVKNKTVAQANSLWELLYIYHSPPHFSSESLVVHIISSPPNGWRASPCSVIEVYSCDYTHVNVFSAVRDKILSTNISNNRNSELIHVAAPFPTALTTLGRRFPSHITNYNTW